MRVNYGGEIGFVIVEEYDGFFRFWVVGDCVGCFEVCFDVVVGLRYGLVFCYEVVVGCYEVGVLLFFLEERGLFIWFVYGWGF